MAQDKFSQEREYLDTMEDLFGHPGWRLMVEEARIRIYQLQADALDKAITKSWDEVNVKRGQAEQLAELIRLPEVIAGQRDLLNERMSEYAN